MIEVFYIAYLKKDSKWGIEAFNKFFKSYETHSAGIEHKLTILLRGFENNPEDYQKIKQFCKEKNIKTIDTKDVGFDFGAYLDGAKQSSADYIFCMNTTCEIMCDDWLKKLYSPTEKNKKYKLVGVNGAYEICQDYLLDVRSAQNKTEKIKAFLNSIDIFRRLYRFFFTPFSKDFPNYLIRTSAFLTDKNLFLEYFKIHNLPENKIDSYQIEGGKSSFSRFILEKGFDYCVIDKLKLSIKKLKKLY